MEMIVGAMSSFTLAYGRVGTEESETHRNLLVLVLELTSELVVHNPLASKSIEEVWKGVELVVISCAENESVEHVWRVDGGGGGGGGGRRRGERAVVVESVHDSSRWQQS
jgi:hypothetical protein